VRKEHGKEATSEDFFSAQVSQIQEMQNLTEILAISSKQVAKFQEAFSLVDLEGNGTISPSDKNITTILNALGFPLREKEIVHIIVDFDGDGREFGMKEFMLMVTWRTRWWKKFGRVVSSDEMWCAINQLRTTLSLVEYANFVRSIDGDNHCDGDEGDGEETVRSLLREERLSEEGDEAVLVDDMRVSDF
jgi:hypothetical protein